MLLAILLFIIGIGLIFKGSDYFVDASVAIGVRARLPRFIVGGTLVSLATTSPEMAVSVVSGLNRVSDLAVGNALGSVAANLGLILGLAALIKPFHFPGRGFRKRIPIMLGLSVFLFLMTIDASLPRWRGIILVAAGLGYLAYDYFKTPRSGSQANGETTAMEPRYKTKRAIALFFLLGLAMVVLGSNLLVTSGSSIAESLGFPPLFVGLTMVAVGTSLPELATALTSLRKGVFDLSIGNIVGANILNMTLVTGLAASIWPLTIQRFTQFYTFPAVAVLCAFFYFTSSSHQMRRLEGGIILALYAAFIAGLAFFQA